MKKVTAILFLFIFCVQAFSFKTHFCYNTDGSRFHGDCTQYMGKDEPFNQSTASFHELKYNCTDIKSDKQYQQHSVFKNFSDQYFTLIQTPELLLITFIHKRQAIPLFSCRGGPPILTSFLRGPPLV